MAKDKGWIKLHRSVLETDIWKRNEPYDYRSAWIDLILMANFRDNNVVSRHGVVNVKRGEIYTSIAFLAKRWRWSSNKVRRYICVLCELEMVRTKGTPSGTTISLVKYGDFQDWRQSDGATNETPNESTDESTDGTQQKNLKECIKNVKEKEPAAEPPSSFSYVKRAPVVYEE